MPISRRQFLEITSSLAASPLLVRSQSAAIVPSDSARPVSTHGVMSGDVVQGSAVIWSRTDRPARMIVEYATNESFQNSTRILGPHCLDVTDFTGRLQLSDIPADTDIFYRVTFQSLADGTTESEPFAGRFRTLARPDRSIRFVWGGDTVGQGWGTIPTSAA
jgi:alkaline phosphatase D